MAIARPEMVYQGISQGVKNRMFVPDDQVSEGKGQHTASLTPAAHRLPLLTQQEQALGAIKSNAGIPGGEFFCRTSQHLLPMSCRVTRALHSTRNQGWLGRPQATQTTGREKANWRKAGIFSLPKGEALKLELRRELTETNFSRASEKAGRGSSWLQTPGRPEQTLLAGTQLCW